MPRPKGSKSKTCHIWTNEEIEYLKSIVEGRSVKDITSMMCEKFNIDVVESQLKNVMRRNKLRNGINPRFKKNSVPSNYKPLLSECEWTNGYVGIKVSEDKWITKQRYIYEKHYGEIPAGYVVVFLDRNKQNFDIDNLVLAKNSEVCIASKKKLFYEDAELTRAGLNVAKLLDKIKEVK